MQNNEGSKLPYYFEKQQLLQEQIKVKALEDKFTILERQKIDLENELRKKKF